MITRLFRRTNWHLLFFAQFFLAVSGAEAIKAEESANHTVVDSENRAVVEQLKVTERGPFAGIRWYCADGEVLPPVAYACQDHGGGRQHGFLSADAKKLRAAGYHVANLMVATPVDEVLSEAGRDDLLKTILLEQFLIQYDDGWLFRTARFYRGAIQLEDEQYAGQQILEGLVSIENAQAESFLILREAARLIPHNHSMRSLQEVRGLAATIGDKDRGFADLRAKIHGKPDAQDATLVRQYAASGGKAGMAADYQRLADMIDEVYRSPDIFDLISRAANLWPEGSTKSVLLDLQRSLQRSYSEAGRHTASAEAMRLIRSGFSLLGPRQRVDALDVSNELELYHFLASRRLVEQYKVATRRDALQWLYGSSSALYGAGMLSDQELTQVQLELQQLGQSQQPLESFRTGLDNIARVSTWVSQRMAFHFEAASQHLAKIEPLALQFVPDRMRGSPALFFADVHNLLEQGGNDIGGVTHNLFGLAVSGGLRSLNPGLARGVLYSNSTQDFSGKYDPDGIYLVDETLAKLPPVAGILTRSEGNALSHVQMLARNLGIPNVVVGRKWLHEIQRRHGTSVVMASTPGGLVRLAADGPEWRNVFDLQGQAQKQSLKIDLDKLELKRKRFIPLRKLRSTDSGRVSGPKAAKLGELYHQYPDKVSNALVIPFAFYKDLLDQPYGDEGESMQEWMTKQYRRLNKLRKTQPELYLDQRNAVLAEIRAWFEVVPFPRGFERKLSRELEDEFGESGNYGVFVRSDTNVEDLDGFSGAGLNLTVHNVVGESKVFEAIRRVWASPFDERAFSWRQELLDKPEHVYVSVLLHQSVAVDRSGVLVTKDLDSKKLNAFTVVVNEGVAGGVDGQLAETVLVSHEESGWVARRLSIASAKEKRVLLAGGGSALVPATGSEKILSQDDISQLIMLVNSVPERVPGFAEGEAVADIEFGFKDDKLWLFQIRPLVENEEASTNDYLAELDKSLSRLSEFKVSLDEPLSRQAQ